MWLIQSSHSAVFFSATEDVYAWAGSYHLRCCVWRMLLRMKPPQNKQTNNSPCRVPLVLKQNLLGFLEVAIKRIISNSFFLLFLHTGSSYASPNTVMMCLFQGVNPCDSRSKVIRLLRVAYKIPGPFIWWYRTMTPNFSWRGQMSHKW